MWSFSSHHVIMCTATTNTTRTSLQLQKVVRAKVVPKIAQVLTAAVRRSTFRSAARHPLLGSRVHPSCFDGDGNSFL